MIFKSKEHLSKIMAIKQKKKDKSWNSKTKCLDDGKNETLCVFE